MQFINVHRLSRLSLRIFLDCRDAAAKLILRHLELRGFRLVVSELTEFLCWLTPSGPSSPLLRRTDLAGRTLY